MERLRKQAEACRKHRRTKKEKEKEEKEELEELQRRNVELRAKVKVMEEMVARWRQDVMEAARGKRKREEEEEERGAKSRRL